MRPLKEKMPVDEGEAPPQTKIRVVGTIDDKLVAKIRDIHQKEIEDAKRRDRVEPSWSNTIEMLLRKGVKIYKQNST